jgi:hypothetical protein
VAELDESIFVLDEDTGQLQHMDVDQKVWTRKASLPNRGYIGASMTFHDGKLYLAGPGIFAWYTAATDTWVQGQKPNKWHCYGSLVLHDSKLLLLGGSFHKGTDEVEEYDFDNETWSDCTWKLPVPLFHHHAMLFNYPEEGCGKCGK